MGLIGSVGGYTIYATLRRMIGGRRGILIAAMVAAWFAVLLSAGACAVELSAWGHRQEFFRTLSWMALVHAAIGLGEALITGSVVRFILLTRPELIEPADETGEQSPSGSRSRVYLPTVLAGLGISLAVAVFLSPFASSLPDGLEFVGDRLGLLAGESPAALVPAPMPDYQLPLPGLEALKAATAIAGLVGTLVVFGLSWMLGRVFAGASVGTPTQRAGANAA
jgi:cobalt/nickel transport system permease protein